MKIRDLTTKELVLYKKTLTLTQVQKDVLVGTLLGDASMSMSAGKPVYAVKFEQSLRRKGYINHLFDLFRPFCGSLPATRLIDKNDNRESIYFKTYRHNCFIYYYNLFYLTTLIDNKVNKVKIVPNNIHELLTPRAVAYWFMDDGTYDTDVYVENGSRSYVFSTHGFQKWECQILVDAMAKNFNVHGSLHPDKGKWRIYYVREDSYKLKALMTPFIHEDFMYKL